MKGNLVFIRGIERDFGSFWILFTVAYNIANCDLGEFEQGDFGRISGAVSAKNRNVGLKKDRVVNVRGV